MTTKYLFERQDFLCYTLLVAIISVLLVKRYVKESKNNGKKLPEPKGSLPAIGHLHLLGRENQMLHRQFGNMADELGPAFGIRLGVHRAMVVSSWEVAKECFTTNDRAFSTRPNSLVGRIMGYDNAMFGFAPYGEYWRDMRKLVTVELLSNYRLEMQKPIQEMEVNLFVKELYTETVKGGGYGFVDLKERFGNLALNIITRKVVGKRCLGAEADASDETRQFHDELAHFFQLTGMVLFSDTIPFFGWLDYIKGYVSEMKSSSKLMDTVMEKWVDEHQKRRKEGEISEEEKDFIHVMLSAVDDGELTKDRLTVSKATCLALILGGNDTTIANLTWTVCLLLNNPRILEKAQQELDTKVGRNRQVNDSDIKELVYLQAIVKETLRLHPAAPLSVPRETMEDCTIAGFHIPRGTRMFLNIWKLQRDPRIWSNPSEFQPERFLEEHANLDYRGQNYEFLPFGSGRRICPGVSFALQAAYLPLARLLHGFELKIASDMPLDMSEVPGFTVGKATPLEVIIKPRLPSTVYDI